MIGFDWFEIKGRYFNINKNSNQQKNQFDILEIFKSVFGLNLAVILCLTLLINSVFLYCLMVKWFYSELIPRLFIFMDNEHSNQTSNKSISIKLETASLSWSIELITCLAYSINLVINRIWFQRFVLNNKFNTIKLTFFILFYVLIIWILIFTFTSTSFVIKMNCENFFKNRQNVSY